MLKLSRSVHSWWQKPLIMEGDKSLPAELVILNRMMEYDEEGAWLNSRGTTTGVYDLIEYEPGKFRTIRCNLPDFVQGCLRTFYDHPDIDKGVFDLVLWRNSDKRIRFIEVKCPHWDRQTPEQISFSEVVRERGIKTEVVEWEFDSEPISVL